MVVTTDHASVLEFSKGAATRYRELLLRCDYSAREVLVVATLMAEFALIQLTDPRRPGQRIEWIDKLRTQLKQAVAHNASVVTPEDIIAHQKELFSDPSGPNYDDPQNPYRCAS
jgi:hypothetical protein